jgi:hypothetical protein
MRVNFLTKFNSAIQQKFQNFGLTGRLAAVFLSGAAWLACMKLAAAKV